MRTVASWPAEMPCISMVVMGVWPSLRMLPVMVDSKSDIYCTARDTVRATTSHSSATVGSSLSSAARS